MEIGETVADVEASMNADKCVLCDSDQHESPKKDILDQWIQSGRPYWQLRVEMGRH